MGEFWKWMFENFHAFWWQSFSETVLMVSDPTERSTPVGVDFFWIEDRGSQFGPYGSLVPVQLDGQIGRGSFTCKLAEEDMCQFCVNNITTDADIVVSQDSETCGSFYETSRTIEEVSSQCKQIRPAQHTCCPEDAMWKMTACAFCNNVFSSLDASLPVPGSNESNPEGVDYTCEDLYFSAQMVMNDDSACKEIQLAESICCPEGQSTAAEDDVSSVKSNMSLAEKEDDEAEDQGDVGGACVFCSGRVKTEFQSVIIPGPEANGATCNDLIGHSLTLESGAECEQVLLAQALCCPGEDDQSVLFDDEAAVAAAEGTN